jgi:transcriptional regulator with XRE-family HTH domain
MTEELLTKQQQTAAQLIAFGGLRKEDIATQLGISRTTLWQWEKSDVMKAEVDRIKQENKILGQQLMEIKLVEAVNKYWDLINKTDNAMVAAKGLEYFIERNLGKVSNKVEVSTSIDKVSVSTDILEEEHAKWERDIIDVEAEEV